MREKRIKSGIRTAFLWCWRGRFQRQNVLVEEWKLRILVQEREVLGLLERKAWEDHLGARISCMGSCLRWFYLNIIYCAMYKRNYMKFLSIYAVFHRFLGFYLETAWRLIPYRQATHRFCPAFWVRPWIAWRWNRTVRRCMVVVTILLRYSAICDVLISKILLCIRHCKIFLLVL